MCPCGPGQIVFPLGRSAIHMALDVPGVKWHPPRFWRGEAVFSSENHILSITNTLKSHPPLSVVTDFTHRVDGAHLKFHRYL